MPRPITRVLAVLELLQSHAQMSGADLAGRLDVDGRTLRRYIAMLEEMGIPITAEYGRHGGYHSLPGFDVPPYSFSEPPEPAIGPGLNPVPEAARTLMAPGSSTLPAQV